MYVYDGLSQFNDIKKQNKDEYRKVLDYKLFIKPFQLSMHLHQEACDVLLLMSTQLCSHESMQDNGWIIALKFTIQNRRLATSRGSNTRPTHVSGGQRAVVKVKLDTSVVKKGKRAPLLPPDSTQSHGLSYRLQIWFPKSLNLQFVLYLQFKTI